jgi:glutamate--cysteine ligase
VQTARFLDVFLLHCLLSDSPPDTPQEIAALGRNQHNTAARGREPGLMLERGQGEVELTAWGEELLDSFGPIAAALDATHKTTDYLDALRGAQALLRQPDLLPSARVLAVMEKDFDNSFTAFGCAQSRQARAKILSLPFGVAQQAKFEALSRQSVLDQKAIEAADTLPFEAYRQQYVSPQRLELSREAIAPALAAV